MKIVIGQDENGHKVSIDVQQLITSNLLLEGATGSGKSYAARKILEELLDLKIQCIMIDPDGELVTLREKFNIVIAGEEGEVPMSIHTAKMLAEKILEHRFSCLCDLSEVKKTQRPEWVKAFLEALMESPKKYWHQTKVVFIDEAHLFAPEKMKSVSLEAVADLAGRGLKRGLVTVAATQRISKFSKDVVGELQNVLVGRHFLKNDRHDSAETLGVVGKQELQEFMAKIKVLPRGDFFAIGAAISEDCLRLHINPVKTTHPERGANRKLMTPPPPAALKGVLEALRDLPAQVQEKLKTEADFKNKIRTLEAELKQAKAGSPVARPAAIKEVKVVDGQAIQRAVKTAINANNALWMKEYKPLRVLAGNLIGSSASAVEKLLGVSKTVLPPMPDPSGIALDSIAGIKIETDSSMPRNEVKVVVTEFNTHPPTGGVVQSRRTVAKITNIGDGSLTGPEQKILNAIAWLNSIGVENPEQSAVSFLAGYTVDGGGFKNPRGHLNQLGHVQYGAGGRISLTESGRALAHVPETPLTPEELQRNVIDRLPGPEGTILRVLISSYPQGLTNEDCAEAAGYTASGGGYKNPRGRLRTLGLIEYVGGLVKAQKLLFLE